MLHRIADRFALNDRISGKLPSVDAILVFVGCVSLLGALLLVASGSQVTSIVAVGIAALLTVIVTFGLMETGTGIIVLAMFFAPCNSIRPSATLSFVTMSDGFFVMGFALLLPALLIRRFQPPMFFVLGSAILILTGVLASLAAVHPGTSLNAMTRLVVAALGLPAAFLLWRPNNKVVVWLASAYVLGQCLSVADAVVSGAAPSTGRYQGLATHVNFFGLSALLAVCLLPYIAAFISPSLRWMVWVAGGVCAYGIWISGSRAALLVFILVALLFPLVERSVPAAGLLAAALSFGLLLSGKLLNESGDNALGRLQGDTTTTFSDNERSRALTESIEVFKAHPLLGTGFEDPLAAHNIYLQIGVAVGVIGVVGYLFLLGSTVRPLFTLPHPYHRLAYPALAYASIGMITNSLWDRFIWSVLSLALLSSFLAKDHVDEDVDDSSTAKRPEHAEEHL